MKDNLETNNTIIISSNENKDKPFISKLVYILESKGKIVSFEGLDSADIVYGKVGMELKLTASDFLSSLNKELGDSASRLERQCLNLSQFEKPHVFICATIPEILSQIRKNQDTINTILTPKIAGVEQEERKTWNFDSITGIMASLESRFGVAFKTWGMIGAEEYVAKILLKSNDGKLPNTIPIRATATTSNRQLAMIGICDGIGKEASRNLLLHHKTIKTIANCTQKELEKVPLIGPTLSKSIYDTVNKEYTEK